MEKDKMKKNARIHIWLETELKEKLHKEAMESSISLNELCRQKLKGNSKLDKIEFTLERIEKSILENKGLYKSNSLADSNK